MNYRDFWSEVTGERAGKRTSNCATESGKKKCYYGRCCRWLDNRRSFVMDRKVKLLTGYFRVPRRTGKNQKTQQNTYRNFFQ